MKTISTFNALHLGDNLIHVHFLRKLAAKYPEIHFTHGTPDGHLAQLYPVWSDLPNLTVQSIAATGQGAINAWRGAGGWYYQQPDQYDFLQIHLRWFRHLAELMGLESPITCAADMLFDYPALNNSTADNADGADKGPGSREAYPPDPRNPRSNVLDFLIINSPPMSGQWSGHHVYDWARLIEQLPYKRTITTARTNLYLCTTDLKLDITGIGKLAQRARVIIGCVTGPMWPTLNIWAQPVLRIHLLDHERVELAPNTVHCNSLSLVPEILKDRGLI